jgi:hypothetical protein
MKFTIGLIALFFAFFAGTFAFAADPVASVSLPEFLAQVLAQIQGFGGLPWMAKISAIVVLIVGSMKVDQVKALLWDKLPVGMKPFLAPGLGVVAGILSMNPITLPGVIAYLGAGAGAIILYELLDAVKVAAGANAVVSMIIGMIQGVLKTGK